jgi:hypothetical protein
MKKWMMRVIGSVSAIVLVLDLASAARAGLLDDMVVLERAYVPVLALTNQAGKEAESRAAMDRFDDAWSAFRSAPSTKADTSLKLALDAAEGHIARARADIVAGKLKEAHEVLEHLRHSLWKWRAGRGIAYFPDLLTAYHDEMERAADAATVPGESGKLAETLGVARARWDDVERATFDAQLHGFDEAKVGRMKGLMSRERAALDELDKLGPHADRAALAAAAKTLKGTFAQIYFLFGDFKGP